MADRNSCAPRQNSQNLTRSFSKGDQQNGEAPNNQASFSSECAREPIHQPVCPTPAKNCSPARLSCENPRPLNERKIAQTQINDMKKLFVQMLCALVCAGSIATAVAASPSGTLGVVVDNSGVWLGPWWSGQNGGTLSEAIFYSGGSKLVVRGTFATVLATQQGASSVLNIFRNNRPRQSY